MGGINTCNCSKEGDLKTELDLNKERRENEKIIIKNNNLLILEDNNNSNAIEFSKKKNNTNMSLNLAKKQNEDDYNLNSNNTNISNISNNLKNYILATKNGIRSNSNGDDKLDNFLRSSSPKHKKDLSNDLNLEIEDDNLMQQDLQIINNGFKKNSNIANNLNFINKAPLEIINEINAEENKKNRKSTSKFNSNKKNTRESNFENKTISDEMSSNLISQINSAQTTNEKNNKNMKMLQNITSVISESKLLNCSEDDVLFQSELKKNINIEKKNQTSQMYSSRFCVLFKSEFRYYKSRESFLTLQKPLLTIPLYQIIEANIVKGYNKNNPKKKDHFYIKLTGPNISDNIRSSRLEIRNSVNPSTEIDTSNNDSAFFKSKKISLIENSNLNNQSSRKRGSLKENEENILFFSADKEDLINKWIIVLNYFINK